MKYYKDHYDVIIIGAALAGLSSAIKLAKEGKSVLVLERHNLPGGVATSFVRDGVEIEATLHELYNVCEPDNPGYLRKYFNDIGMPINFKRVPDSYRLIDQDIDITIPSSFEGAAKEIDKLYPGNYDKLMEFFELCKEVNLSLNKIQTKPITGKEIFKNHVQLFKTATMTAKEVMDSFGFPKEVQEILGVYWIYLGTPPEIIPFTIFSVVVDEYIRFSPYIPEHKSYEMGAKLAEYAESLGVQIEYEQHVEHILVNKKKVYGVKTQHGEEIHSDYVISGVYPESVYSKMIYPNKEVPKMAKKFAASRETSLTAYGVQLYLDKSPEELNLTSYAYFTYPEKYEASKAYENMATLGPYKFLVVVCYNVVDPDVSPKGTTLLDIVVMPRTDAWESVTKEEYAATKRRIADEMITSFEKIIKTDLKSHIINLTYQTPMSYAHYADAYKGSVYGYKHQMKDHVFARFLQLKQDRFIKGLYFTGAHYARGDGQMPQFQNGEDTAKEVLNDMNKAGGKKHGK